MKSSLKTALPIVLVVLMVGGLSFMAQFTAAPKPKDDDAGGDAGPAIDVISAEEYGGYFEVGTTNKDNRVGFLIRNPHPTPVFLTALTPSCALCTAASGAVVPTPVLQAYLQRAAAENVGFWPPNGTVLSGMPWVRFGDRVKASYSALTAGPWAAVRGQLKWHEFAFSDTSNKFEVPAAAADGSPTWAVLELGFDMKDAGKPAGRSAYFDAYDAAGKKLTAQPFTFTVVAGGREVMELLAAEHTVGRLTESTPSQTVDVVCLSALRDALPPPAVAVSGGDPFVTVGPPQPLSADALNQYSQAASTPSNPNGPRPPIVYYKSGYRVPVTVSRQADGKLMDAGRYEKELFVSGGPGVTLKKPLSVVLRGTVMGVVQLDGADKIDFGGYDSNFTQKKEVRLWSDRPGVELEVLADQTLPSFLKASLGKPTAEEGRTYWPLTVQIPAKESRGAPWDGVVYLRTKGPTTLNIRLPVSGHGR